MQTLKRGFTLVELLVVIAIIAILISVGAVSYTRSLKLSRDSRRLTDLEQIRQALEIYRSENGVYPATVSWQSALSSGGAYIAAIPVDPKEDGSTYTYTYTLGATDLLYSLCATTLERTGAPHCVSQP